VRRIDNGELSIDDVLEIRQHADTLLKEAGAYGKFPTPTADLVAAAGLKVEHTLFTDERILKRMEAAPAERIKRARGELLGVVDLRGRTIYVSPEIPLGNLPPLVLHETAHAYLRWQRDIYLYAQEGGTELRHDIRDRFEREANQFAWELLFQLDHFRHDAERGEFSLRTPVQLARRYGTTCYAAIRWFVKTNRRACALLIMGPSHHAGDSAWSLRRIMQSPRFTRCFGQVPWPKVLNHTVNAEQLASLDYGARLQFCLLDLNQHPVDCEMQSFCSEPYHFVLAYPNQELCAAPLF